MKKLLFLEFNVFFLSRSVQKEEKVKDAAAANALEVAPKCIRIARPLRVLF